MAGAEQVPVEVPEGAVEAAERAVAQHPGYAALAPRAARVAVEAAYPLIAARVRAEERQLIIAVLHQEALRVADVPPDSIRTEAYWAGRVEGVLATKTLVAKALAAGSAVPVATPEPPKQMSRWAQWLLSTVDPAIIESGIPVATPTEPAHGDTAMRECSTCQETCDVDASAPADAPVRCEECAVGPAEQDGQSATTPEPIDLLTALQRSIDRARGVEQDGAGPARSSAALNCDTCDDTGAVRMEYDGSPGSGGWFSCPDCMPTPSVPVDEPVEQDGQR